MPPQGDRLTRLTDLLTEAFDPTRLDIKDDSAAHAGHAGAAPGGETHYTVTIEAEAFRGLSRVQIHRTVNMVLAREFDAGLHALSLKASVPDTPPGET